MKLVHASNPETITRESSLWLRSTFSERRLALFRDLLVVASRAEMSSVAELARGNFDSDLIFTATAIVNQLRELSQRVFGAENERQVVDAINAALSKGLMREVLPATALKFEEDLEREGRSMKACVLTALNCPPSASCEVPR